MAKVYCGPTCREGYVCDRAHGLCYGAHRLDGRPVSRVEFCRALKICRYCGASLVKP